MSWNVGGHLGKELMAVSIQPPHSLGSRAFLTALQKSKPCCVGLSHWRGPSAQAHQAVIGPAGVCEL